MDKDVLRRISIIFIVMLIWIVGLTVNAISVYNEVKSNSEELKVIQDSASQIQSELDELNGKITSYQSQLNEMSQKYETMKSNHLGTFTTTAYCKCTACCGIWSDSPTKSGTTPQEGRTIAVDPNVIPLGTKVSINGKVYTAEDTGSAIKGNKIDIYFASHQDAQNYGRQQHKVYLLR